MRSATAVADCRDECGGRRSCDHSHQLQLSLRRVATGQRTYQARSSTAETSSDVATFTVWTPRHEQLKRRLADGATHQNVVTKCCGQNFLLNCQLGGHDGGGAGR